MKHVDKEQCDDEDGLYFFLKRAPWHYRAAIVILILIGSLSIWLEDSRPACMMRPPHVYFQSVLK